LPEEPAAGDADRVSQAENGVRGIEMIRTFGRKNFANAERRLP
jgi:hypothetical protein